MSAPQPRTPVSVLVPTLNEERNLPACLASLAFADEVFVLDSLSTDGTRQVAESYGATVVPHAFEGYSRQKNWGLTNLPFRNAWVLIVDADERVPPPLAREIADVIEHDGQGYDGFYLNRRFIFLGHWIRHAGWYPSWNLRLFRRGRGLYDQRDVHEHLILDGRAGYLRHDLLHDDQRDLEAFVARHNRYSSLEAAARLKAQEAIEKRSTIGWNMLVSPVQRKRVLRERVWPSIPAKPLALFLYMYVLRQGFRDGRAGLALCVFHAWQEFMVGLKLVELRRLSSRRP